jgi:hypothetical protein
MVGTNIGKDLDISSEEFIEELLKVISKLVAENTALTLKLNKAYLLLDSEGKSE